MSSERSKTLTSFAFNGDSRFNRLNINVKYLNDVTCLSTSKPIINGLFLVITPSFEENNDGFKTTRLASFTGFKMLIRPLDQFSQKQLLNCLPREGLLHYAISDVAMKNHISLKTDDHSHDENILALTNAYAQVDEAV
jgi:hypothetical protein